MSADLSRTDPALGLDTHLEGWLVVLCDTAVATRTAYVGDVGDFARRLGGRVPQPNSDESVAWLGRGRLLGTRSGVRLGTLVRAAHALAALDVRDLDHVRIETALDEMASTSSPSSALRQVSALASFLSYLVDIRALETSPLVAPMNHLVPVVRSEHDALSREEERALYGASAAGPAGRLAWPVRDVAAMRLLIGTGLNRGEFLSLAIDDVDLLNSIVVVTGRGDVRRVLDLNEATTEALVDYVEERDAKFGGTYDPAHLFVRTDGSAFDARSLYRLVEQLFERAGVEPRPGSMTHLLRDTFALRCAERGLSVDEVQRQLGHTNGRSTQRLLAARQH
ncbi:MAG: site-specific integrase [Acidimicrobiaceae bacterium]|nr:site-specific integrase [Acidimicrobiaceae bacterium]